MKCVIEEVNVLLHQRAGNVLPVDAGVGCASDSLTLRLSRYRPAGFRNPNCLALGSGNDLVVRIVEGRVGVADAVSMLDFPVRIRINSEEVKSTDNGAVTCARLDRGRYKQNDTRTYCH